MRATKMALVLVLFSVSVAFSGHASGQDSFATTLQFDGLDDEVVVPDHDSLRLAGDFTIEAWVKLSDQTASVFTSVIVGKSEDQGDPTANYWLNVANSSHTLFFLIGDGDRAQSVTGSTELNSETWTHVAGVRTA
ncbi:MAG: LamG-like jellyroll fold domain-containing protein, partial [Planctomycetota bacterium]